MIHPALIQSTTTDPTGRKSTGTTIDPPYATVMAGLADRNPGLFRRLGLPLGDPAAWIRLPDDSTIGLVRDLEMDRVRQAACVQHVTCPAEFNRPDAPLSGDRETAVAQSLSRCLKQHRIDRVVADRTFPLIMANHLAAASIAVHYDDELGVRDRRVKTDGEIAMLRRAQSITEEVMRLVCQRIAGADVGTNDVLTVDGEVLTSDSIRSFAAIEFLKRNCTMTHGAICAGPPHSGDCHHSGSGPLHTNVPIIVDLYPRDESTRYHGDCTRTVVHGKASDTVLRMHEAVVAAKAAAELTLTAGCTGADVQVAVEQCLIARGYMISRGTITDEPSIQHGTGHGIGLDIHEPILLDHGGGEMLAGEVFTVEPGLYGRRTGGVRVEDMLVVTNNGPINLNALPMGLNWQV